MRRIAIVSVLALAVLAAYYLLRRAPPGLAPGASGEPPAESAEARRLAGREKLLALKQALDRVPVPRAVRLSGPERRPGESDALYEERQRAIREYQRFLDSAQLAPERATAIASIIAGAQDSWKAQLESLGRAQPADPGDIVRDEQLGAIMSAITEDAHRTMRGQLEGVAAMTVQSFMPSMLPYARTRVFEPAP